MSLLLAGIVLFSGVHLFPSAAAGARAALIAKLGNNAYRGIFAVIVLASLLMIVFGWKSAVPGTVYAPPLRGGPITALLILIAFVLFAAAQTKTNIKRFVRHPQLTGVLFWAGAHLLVNGDSRSVALFGGLGVWAVLEILLCSRRDGSWQKPPPAGIGTDLLTVAAGALGFAVLLYFHLKLFGVAPF